jgi:hypothetical protein
MFRSLIAVASLTAAMASVLAAPSPHAAAADGTPNAATGAGTLTSFTVTSARTVDGNTILDGVATWTLTGTISGNAVEQFRQIVFSDGEFDYQATGTVTGVGAECGAGEMPFRSHASGTLAAYSGRHVSTDQADTTANIAMDLVFVGSGGSLTYTGTYHCR